MDCRAVAVLSITTWITFTIDVLYFASEGRVGERNNGGRRFMVFQYRYGDRSAECILLLCEFDGVDCKDTISTKGYIGQYVRS